MCFNSLRKPTSEAIKTNTGQGNYTYHPFLCILKAMYYVFILEQNMLVLDFIMVNQLLVYFC